MISKRQFQVLYPSLVKFAKEDPTYRRRNKSGKISIVRKGKRRGLLKNTLHFTGALGTGVAGLIAGKKAGDIVSRKLLYKSNLSHKIANPLVRGGLLAGGAGTGLLTAARISNAIRKRKNK